VAGPGFADIQSMETVGPFRPWRALTGAAARIEYNLNSATPINNQGGRSGAEHSEFRARDLDRAR
jgi:hypothetical protein